jgi:two-component system response regulator
MKRKSRPITILMADDDADDRELTKYAFQRAGVMNDLRFVRNGVELMDYLHRRGKFRDPVDSPRPGLILLDLNMPRKDGREALREIKSDPALRRIRVIVLTTSKTDQDIEQSYEISVASFIVKPVTFEGLVDVVRTIGKYWLELVELPKGPDGV